jgi:hypothetical protein
MGRKYARGDRAWGICGRSARKMLLKDMVFDGRYPNMRVDPAWFEPKDPLDYAPKVDDPVALWRPAPDNWIVEATLALSGIAGNDFVLTWSGVSPVAQIERYDLFAKATDDEDWQHYGSYTPTYDQFGGVVDPATTASIPLFYYTHLFMLVARDSSGGSGAAYLQNERYGVQAEFHIMGSNASATTHPFGRDMFSLREYFPGDGGASEVRRETTGMYYGYISTSTLGYGPNNADNSTTPPTGAVKYTQATTPFSIGTIKCAMGWNKYQNYLWFINGQFDGASPRTDFIYVDEEGNFTALTTPTARHGRGFRQLTWTDEDGVMYLVEKSDAAAGQGTIVLKKFPGIGEPPVVATTSYPTPAFLGLGSSMTATTRIYGYGEVYIPELGYVFIPRIITQNNDTANVPWRVPFHKDWDVNEELVGEELPATLNGAVTFSYAPELGILVCGVSDSYNSSTRYPLWSGDGGTTWNTCVDLSYAGSHLLNRCPFIKWYPEVGMFVATSVQLTNNGICAFFSRDGKNWIILGRFLGTTTSNTSGNYLDVQYVPRELVEPEYATLDPNSGQTNSVLSNDNLTVTVTQSVAGQRYGSFGKAEGKYYWEVSIDSGANSVTAPRCGILRRGISPDTQAFISSQTGACFAVVRPKADWDLYEFSTSATATGVGSQLSVGDRMIFALDIDARKFWFGQNGSWLNGDPEAGTGGLDLPYSVWTPSVGASGVSSNPLVMTFHNEPSKLSYTPPTGFGPFTRGIY